jgi:hypothetical protein
MNVRLIRYTTISRAYFIAVNVVRSIKRNQYKDNMELR